jgi:post-segregation antitoxin (ccd killing protein)
MGKALDGRPRKSTNVTLPPEVLDRAKALGINLSRASAVCAKKSRKRRLAAGLTTMPS